MEKKQSIVRWQIKKAAWIISGENPYLLQKADRKSQLWHYFIGFFMGTVILVKIAALFIFFHSLIESIWLSLTLSFFVSISIFNILRLLIISFSTPTVPVKNEKGLPVFISRFIRYVIVVLLALFIAQPIAVYLFSEELQPLVENHRKEQFNKLNSELNVMYEEEIATINEIIANSGVEDKVYYNKQLEEKANAHQNQIRIVSNLINQSNYFIYQVKQLHKTNSYPFILFQLFIVLLYYLPVLFKRRTQVFGNIQKLKEEHDIQLVSSEYQKFKTQYKQTLSSLFNYKIDEHELYEDPPFNTVLKRKEYQKQKAFIRLFRSNKDEQLGIGISKYYLQADFKAKFVSKMVVNGQEFSLDNIYDIELVNLIEEDANSHDLCVQKHKEFSTFFSLVTTYTNTINPITQKITEKKPFLLNLENTKIKEINIDDTVLDIDQLHGKLSGKLNAIITYKDIEDRLRIHFIDTEKDHHEIYQQTKPQTVFPWLVKVLYLLPPVGFVISLLIFVYTHSGNVLFFTFTLLILLVASRIYFNKSISKRWIKYALNAGIVLSSIIVVSHGITYLTQMVLSLFE